MAKCNLDCLNCTLPESECSGGGNNTKAATSWRGSNTTAQRSAPYRRRKRNEVKQATVQLPYKTSFK